MPFSNREKTMVQNFASVVLFICNVLEEEFGSAYKCSPLIRRLVEAGHLGSKSGRGFYQWTDGRPGRVNEAVARYRIK